MLENIILTDARERRGYLYLTFFNIGSLYVDWEHIFPTHIFGSIEELENIKEVTERLGFDVIDKYKKTGIFKLLQVKTSIKNKEKLPKAFITGHYNEEIRARFGYQGLVYDIDDPLSHILVLRRDIEQKLDEIGQYYSSHFIQTTATRYFNELYRSVDKNNEIPAYILKNTPNNIIDKRRSLQPKIVELRKKVHELGGDIFYNKNERTYDIVIPDTRWLSKKRNITIDELFDKGVCVIDIEIPEYNTSEEAVTWVGLRYYKGGYEEAEIHTVHSTVDSKIGTSTILNYSTIQELIDGVKYSISKHNPLVISAYNSSFDLIKLREEDSKNFGVGEKGKNPIKEVAIKFFERIGIRGKIVIDLLRITRTIYSYLPNQKLETIVKHCLDRRSEKSISYREMRELEKKSKKGDKESAQEIALYLDKDTEWPMRLFFHKDIKNFMIDMNYLSSILNLPLYYLLYSPTKINEAQEREYFNTTGIFRSEVFKKNKALIKKEQQAKSYLYSYLKTVFNIQSKLGLHDNVKKAYLPLGSYLEEILEYRFDRVSDIRKYKNKVGVDSQRRFNLERYETALITPMLTIFIEWFQQRKRLESLIDEYNQTTLSRSRISKYDLGRLTSKLMEEVYESNPTLYHRLKNGKIKPEEIEFYFKEELFDRISANNIIGEKLLPLVIEQIKLNKITRKIEGNYGPKFYSKKIKSFDTPGKIEDSINRMISEIKQFLDENEIEPIFYQGSFLYLHYNRNLGKDIQSPFIIVDEIDSVYITKKRIFYKKYNVYNGFDYLEENYFFNRYEQKIFKEFLDNIFLHKKNIALISLFENFCDYKNHSINKEELLWFNKTKRQYEGYVIDKVGRVAINEEQILKNNWKIDYKKYDARIKEILFELVYPLLGKNTTNFLNNPLGALSTLKYSHSLLL